MKNNSGFSILFSLFVVFFVVTCANENSKNATTSASSVSGNAIKGPIDSAEIKIFYFDADGSEIEIFSKNAPVFTNIYGAYEFVVKPSDIVGIISPLIVRTIGGSMGTAPAPVLEAIIADPSSLTFTDHTIFCHLSVASSVAAGLLKKQVLITGIQPTTSDAKTFINRVEDQLSVNLNTDPKDTTQGIANVNEAVDQNVDLISNPQNNTAVNDYIAYLIANLSSISGSLDGDMDDPDNPGSDIPATFLPFGNGDLASILPDGPSAFWRLRIFSEKQFINHNREESATITAEIKDALGNPVPDNDVEITFRIASGQGSFDSPFDTANGQSVATLTSSMLCGVVVQATCELR